MWGQVEARLDEAAADNLGHAFPLRWELAIKTHVLLMIVGVILIVSGFSLGDIADEAITWVSYYDDDTKTEGDDKTSGTADADGTSAQQDIILHLVTAIYGWFVFSAMSLSSFIFAWSFLNVKGDGEDFECDTSKGNPSEYAKIAGIFQNVTDKQSCLENMPAVVNILDLNGDHIISRCEQATWQMYVG